MVPILGEASFCSFFLLMISCSAWLATAQSEEPVCPNPSRLRELHFRPSLATLRHPAKAARFLPSGALHSP
jgi:hypothetical protein